MTVEKVSAGPAMQRAQPMMRAVLASDVRQASEEQKAVGGAPDFDRATEALVTPKAGILANPVMQQFTSVAQEEHTVKRTQVENVDAGATSVKEIKKPAGKPSPPKKSQKRGSKRG